MICPKCGSEVPDGSAFCTKCGAAMNAGAQQGMPQGAPNPQQGAPNGQPYTAPNGQPYGNANGQPYGNANGQPYGNGAAYGMPQQQPYIDPRDHTAEFSPKDISENKVIAMIPYLMGTVGIILALLASKESPYVAFHVRQAMKLAVCNVLLGICMGVLFWTVIVPIAAAVCMIIILVVRIISFFQICSGKAKEVAIVGSFGFLK